MTFGSFYINGQNILLPGGGQQTLGPFAIAFSGVQNTTEILLQTGLNTIPTPDPGIIAAIGVWIILIGGLSTVQLAQDLLSPGIFLNPGGPSFWYFDPANYPAQIYLTAGDTTEVVIQYV